MQDSEPTKAQLRSTLRRLRLALSPDRQAAAARAVANYVTAVPRWRTAQRIALYQAADGEVDTAPLAELGNVLGKRLFLPCIENDSHLSFALWQRQDALSVNRYNIPEPPATAARCAAPELDIIFLPLVGWDLLGGRLGMGGGFYDRTLAGVSGPLLIGLAHEVQKVERIPRDAWDVSLDFIATDTALYCCQGANLKPPGLSPG